jgi:UPF0176 protein
VKGKKVAMFCTGGIRCEKATAFVKNLGIEEVYHLKGGILKYLEDVPEDESLWHGDCFVFDERVAVGHGLEPGDYTLVPRLPPSADAEEETASEQICRGRLLPALLRRALRRRPRPLRRAAAPDRAWRRSAARKHLGG